MDVEREQGVYHVYLEMQLAAPKARLLAVLTDYHAIPRLNPSVSYSAVLPAREAGVTRVLTRLQDCVLFFCRTVERVEGIRVFADGDLEAVTEPQAGAFKAAQAYWRIRANAQGSRLIYCARLQPDFWLPPVLGPGIIRSRLRQNLLSSVTRLEYYAQFPAGTAPPQAHWSEKHE